MILKPLNRTATQKLLRQGQRNGYHSALTLYLRAFGVKDLTLQTLPECISQDFAAEWAAFLRTNLTLKRDPARRALQAVLSFLQYASSLKLDVLDPHFAFRDPLTGESKINPNKIRYAVVKNDLQGIFQAIRSYALKFRLSYYFKVYRTKTSMVVFRQQAYIVTVWALTCANSRMNLDAVLPILEGQLYDGSLPPQLQKVEKNGKDQRPYFDQLLNGIGTVGWYPISRSSVFQLWTTRARGGYLMIKALVPLAPVSKDNGDIPHRDQLKIWNKFKLFSSTTNL